VVPTPTTEIVSPNDKADELLQKVCEYFRAGVEMVWVVYPTVSIVYIYMSPTQIAVLSKNDVLEGGTVFPGFRLPLSELFTQPDATANGER